MQKVALSQSAGGDKVAAEHRVGGLHHARGSHPRAIGINQHP